MEEFSGNIKGRGARINPDNPYLAFTYDTMDTEGLDEALEARKETKVLLEYPKKIINKVPSPDIPLDYSMNPYQGCEHGCVYCYARNTHAYWGLSAGLDFEQKIIAKPNAPELLEEALMNKKWKAAPIMFSGNTDCYQPVEREMQLTRKCLEVFLRFRHPVGLITKNHLILRDIDILEELANHGLVHVFITITTLDKELRLNMEPRTATASHKLDAIKRLKEKGVPTGVMIAPIIPGLNVEEIPTIMEAASDAGALAAGYTIVRLNGAVQEIFSHWLHHHYPDRAEKVLNQIKGCHDGSLADHQFGRRMRGKGPVAEAIRQLFHLARQKYLKDKKMPPYDLSLFKRPEKGQLSLF